MARVVKNVDWDAVERDYRAGIKTLREIAGEHGIVHAAVRQRAIKYGWERNLDEKIKVRAKAIVAKASRVINTPLSKETESEIIESVAQLQASALLTESAEIKKLIGIANEFVLELQTCPEDLDKRARILKLLVEVSEKLINLRRRNLNISDNSNGDADAPKEITRIELVALK